MSLDPSPQGAQHPPGLVGPPPRRWPKLTPMGVWAPDPAPESTRWGEVEGPHPGGGGQARQGQHPVPETQPLRCARGSRPPQGLRLPYTHPKGAGERGAGRGRPWSLRVGAGLGTWTRLGVGTGTGARSSGGHGETTLLTPQISSHRAARRVGSSPSWLVAGDSGNRWAPRRLGW